MSGKFDGETCPVCGVGTLHDDVRQTVLDYRGERFTADQSGAYCDRCNEGVIYFDPSIEDRWEQFRADVEAKQARELLEIRARLKITQELASKLSGGGHNAFSRYERREVVPVLGVMHLFRLLDNDPSRINELMPKAVTSSPTTAGIMMISFTHKDEDEDAVSWPSMKWGEHVHVGGHIGDWIKLLPGMVHRHASATDIQMIGRATKRLVPRASKVTSLKTRRKQA